jgi:hypothetical protein
MIGLMLALFGVGVVLLALERWDGVSFGAVLGALVGLLLILIGARQVYGAARGRLPKWYGELLVFAGGVFVRGPARRQ